MGDVGGGIRFYPYGNFFVRPEVRLYLIHNNVETAVRFVRNGQNTSDEVDHAALHRIRKISRWKHAG